MHKGNTDIVLYDIEIVFVFYLVILAWFVINLALEDLLFEALGSVLGFCVHFLSTYMIARFD